MIGLAVLEIDVRKNKKKFEIRSLCLYVRIIPYALYKIIIISNYGYIKAI